MKFLVSNFKKEILLMLFLQFMYLNAVAQPQKSLTSDNRNYPVVPFNTNFWNYWDHYWMTWLDDHPKYESIELTAFDNPENPDYKLIRVFLSEKDGEKLQYYYLNDSTSVERSQANSFYRDITYERRGNKNGPQSLYVKFKDKDDIEIEWEIDFDQTKRLKDPQKGLTPSVHSVGYVLLFHIAKKRIDTRNDKVLFDGVDFAYKNKIGGKRSWHNRETYSAVIIHGRNQFMVNGDTLSNTWGRTFAPIKGDIYKSNMLAKENFIRFEVDNKNNIKSYEQISFGHSFQINFEPFLPNYQSASDGLVVNFSAGFDDLRGLMEGQIRVTKSEDGLLYNWKPSSPEWATWRSFKSIIDFNDTGYRLTTYE